MSALGRLLVLLGLGALAASGRVRVGSAGRAGPRRGVARTTAAGAPAAEASGPHGHGDRAPGDDDSAEEDFAGGITGYAIGLALAALLTFASFWVAKGGASVWGPGVPVALVVLAIAQMGLHLVFFLHVTTGADNTNNVLALAFGTLIVILVIGGSLWIMANLDHATMPLDELVRMQR